MLINGHLEYLLHTDISLIQRPRLAEKVLSEALCIVWRKRKQKYGGGKMVEQ